MKLEQRESSTDRELLMHLVDRVDGLVEKQAENRSTSKQAVLLARAAVVLVLGETIASLFGFSLAQNL